ncbi:Bro-N domain-containing protein [Candidatus Woesearchaeota archaeon]|nr:Bro-N domain-containing protein [Candidatus Woesearchaeota archaeon]
MDSDKALVVFQSKKIRRTWFNDEWWFAAVDIVGALTDSKDPSGYLKDMRRRDEGFKEGWGQIATPLEIATQGGKQRINCVSTKGAFRLIQSVPSRKAEPFKIWLAQVGYDRVQEIENPELAQERMKEIYSAKGYPKDWIDKRLRGIAIRQNLTDEWRERGIEEKRDFAILTAEISKATFGMNPGEYKDFKNLPKKSKANLRDHMNDLELIFTMLGERMTTELSQEERPENFDKSRDIAKRGGRVAGNARIDAEKELGRPVSTKQNYLSIDDRKKKLQHKNKE